MYYRIMETFEINRNIGMNRRSDRRCSVKKMFTKISQNSKENTYASVYFLIKLQVSGNREVYSEPCQATRMELFAKIYFEKSSILDV